MFKRKILSTLVILAPFLISSYASNAWKIKDNENNSIKSTGYSDFLICNATAG